MKLKYYLRGMGIGIILTAIVMGFALGGRKATISDAEIIERAKALGMVDPTSGVLPRLQAELTQMKRIRLHPVRHWIKQEKKYLKKSTRNSLQTVNQILDWMKRLSKERKRLKARALRKQQMAQKIQKVQNLSKK